MNPGKGACHPSVMGLSPVPAVQDLFKRNPDLKLNDFELLELNEAFAAQYIRVEREFGDYLVVAVNSDRSAMEIKGEGRPVIAQEDRTEVLAALSLVDAEESGGTICLGY